MTTTGLPATKCPQCSSPYVVDLEDGTRFCPECRIEWDPTKPQTADDVLGPPLELNEPAAAVDVPAFDDEVLAEAYLETLVGTRVVLEGGQGATLLGFTDDDHALVRLDDGRDETVPFGDIERSVPDETPATIAELDIDDATAELVGDAALTFACLIIEAGVASIEGSGPDARLIESPVGWLPADELAIPLLEQGAAAAVAMLMITFDIPRDLVVAAVEKVRPTTRQGDTTGGTK